MGFEHGYRKCPCIDETPDSINIESRIKTLIITVHGTGATHAKWTYTGKLPDSLLKDSPDTQMSRFCWSGGNSHAKRLKAGEDLADYIRDLSRKYPEIKLVLIGHSHGGNVIMYAINKLRETNDENKVKKVVTLATPYLNMKLKKLNPRILYSSFLLALLCLIELKLGNWQIQTNYFAITMLSIFIAWQFMILISIFSQRKIFKRLWHYLLIVIGKDRDLSILENEISDFELKHTQSGIRNQNKHLIISPVGDEATLALTVSEFLTWSNIFMLKLFSKLSEKSIDFFIRTTKEYYFRFASWFGFEPEYVITLDMDYEEQNKIFSALDRRMQTGEYYLGILSFILTGITSIFIMGDLLFPKMYFAVKSIGPEIVTKTWDNIGILIWPIIVVIATIVLAGSVFCILGIISVLCLFFMTISSLAFGLDAVFWSLFVQTTVESTPPGLYSIYIHSPDGDQRIDKELDLAHSLIYNQDKVINRIKTWLLKY